MLITANYALAGCLGWKWSLWPVPDWLEVQRSKSVFFLTLYDSISYMKNFRTVCITPQPCHSHFCCWLLPIWPKLDFLGWKWSLWPVPTWLAVQRSKMYNSWPYMIISIIWNTSKQCPSYLSLATAIFVVDCWEFGASLKLGLKWSFWPVPTWLEVQHSKAVFFLTLNVSINYMK